MPGSAPQHDHRPDRRLPVDSDIEVVVPPARPRRPMHRRPVYLALVAAGGAVGVTGRYLITAAGAPQLGQPGMTMIINVGGCLLLGILLEALALAGPDRGLRRQLRLLVGTGILGGFTTYSTFAVDTATLLGSRAWLSALYAVGSIVLGVTAAAAGVWIAAIGHHRRSGGRR